MLIKSAKEKGKRFENWIAQQLKESGIDPRASREIGSGSGKSKGDIRSTIDFLIEAKNQKTIHFLDNVDQAKSQARQGFISPSRWALITRDPRSPEFDDVYITIDFWQFINLYKKSMEPKTLNPDRSLRYDLENLKRLAQKVIKQLE